MESADQTEPRNLEERKSVDDVVIEALDSEAIPKLYANGFISFASNADIGVVLQLHGRPVALLNMSYTLAKTLSRRLAGIIEEIESDTERNFLTTDDVAEAASKKAAGKKDNSKKDNRGN